MAGAASNSIVDAFIKETVAGTTPATPAFTKASFDRVTMSGNPRITEVFARSAQGDRSGLIRSGTAVAGSAEGPLIYGEYDDWWESLFQSTWATNVLTNGKDQVTMSIEQNIPQGVGGALAYTRFRGCEAVGAQLQLRAGQPGRVSFDVLGTARDAASATPIVGATYTDPTVTDPLGSGSDIGTITMSGFTLDCIESLNIDFQIADKTEQPRVSSDELCGISRGALRPVITGRFYVEANFISLFEAATNGTDFQLQVPVGSVTTEKYNFNFPVCQFTTDAIAPEAGAAFVDYTILPKYDAGGIDATCQLTRAIV